MKRYTFNNGNSIPAIGLGVFLAKDGEETYRAVRWALEVGYRHIDTAAIYGNEESVGRAIKDSGINREDIFVTTKLWTDDVRAGNVRGALKTSLGKLGLAFVDLYLIHWPAEGYVEAYLEMEKCLEEGLIKNIGVSNFHKHHLEKLASKAHICPAVNQIESNPCFPNNELIAYCKEKGIVVEAWSPFGGSRQANILNKEELLSLAAKYGVTSAQLLISWHLQRGVVVLPKSVHKERIISNLDVDGLLLSDGDISAIDDLVTGVRAGSDPDNFNF